MFVCLLGGVGFSHCVLADDDTPTIVITPNRSPTALDSVPASVSVIDRSTMERQGMVGLQDAVQDLPGVSLSRSASFGGISSLFLRGAQSNQTLVLLDGMPITDPTDPQGAFNFGEDLLGNIERIEVARGPGSVLYGSNAVGGVVNLISRQPADGFEPQAKVYGGSYGTFGGEALASGHDGKLGYVLDVERQHSDGFDALPRRFPTYRHDPKGWDTYAVFGKLGYELDGSTRVEGQIRWRDSTFGMNDVPFNSPNDRGQTAALNWQVRAERDWLDKQATSSLTFSDNVSRRDYSNEPDPVALAGGSNQLLATYRGDRYDAILQNDFRLPDVAALGLSQHTLIVDASYAEESTDVGYRSDGIYGPYDLSAKASSGTVGAFGEWRARFLDRVDVTAGLREDFPDAYASHTTERVGAVLQLPEIGGRVRSAYGTSYRAPSLFERYGVDNYGLVGNANLAPETAKSWEAGWEKDIAAGGMKKFATLGSTYFETSSRNLIDYRFGPPPQYINVARAEISGAESWIKANPFYWLQGEVNWTWLRSVNASGQSFSGTPDGKPLLRRPQNTVTSSLTFQPRPEWRVTPKLRYVGPQYDQMYDDSGAFIGRGRVGGYMLADLGASYRLTDHISAYSNMRNLLDRRVESPNGYLLEPFMVMVGLKYE